MDTDERVERNLRGIPGIRVDELLNVNSNNLISFTSHFTSSDEFTSSPNRVPKRRTHSKIHTDSIIQPRKIRGFSFKSHNKFELRHGLVDTPIASQRRSVTHSINSQSANAREVFHSVSGPRVPHIQSEQRVFKIIENSTTLLELSAGYKPDLSCNKIINQIQTNFKPLPKEEAIKIGQNIDLIRRFRKQATRKPTSNSRYAQKQRFFIREFLNKLDIGKDIKNIDDLIHHIEKNNSFPETVEKFLFTRALSGTDPKTIRGDLSALNSIWEEVRESKISEVYPAIKETMKAIEHTFSKTKSTSKPFRFKELHQYFKDNKSTKPTEILLLEAQKLGFIFTTRPSAILDLRKDEFIIEKMILDLNSTKVVGRIRVFDAKTSKNKNCYQDHYSNTHDHGFNLYKIKETILKYREENENDHIFFINGQKLKYSDGYHFFQKAIKNFKTLHPEYQSMKFTPGSFRISSMTVRYKFNKEIVDKLRHRAQHSLKGRTMEKSYLIKDPTLTFLNE